MVLKEFTRRAKLSLLGRLAFPFLGQAKMSALSQADFSKGGHMNGYKCNIMAGGVSDLDIGVRLIPGNQLTAKEKVELTLRLEEFFSIKRVDLVMIHEADPFLAANIIRGERLYAYNETEADEYDLYILGRAGDCIPLERERMELILGGVE